ncbi:MAG TPA: hypothetical protein VKA94_13490 [Hyphomicrobiales bacterium]|nr:hypothetical protein [Hyphomicrobiales bacterium]
MAIDKWFATEFVRGMKLTLLKQIHNAGAFEVFAEMLSKRSDVDRIAILNKVDKHNPRAQMLSKKQSLEHLKNLANGTISPLPKPRTTQSNRKRSSPKTTAKDLMAASKY